jgi:hypothetical protein
VARGFWRRERQCDPHDELDCDALTVTTFTQTCPQCGSPWEFRAELVGKPASGFASCAFRCMSCGIGFSNATSPSARVRITLEPQRNVPSQARAGLAEALAGAINVHNRPAKREKFCSERSEDAVTWTVTAGLREVVGLGALVGEAGLRRPQALLLWGHPVEGERAAEVRDRLVSLSDDLGEKPDRRSEPDVIALWPSLLAFVEAKHGSTNDRKPHYAGYSTYLPVVGRFSVDDQAIRREGSYQLVRNWVMGSMLAEALGVSFVLVNLGPPGIAHHADDFAALLLQSSTRRFEHRTWRHVFDAVTVPEWLVEYAREHGLQT